MVTEVVVAGNRGSYTIINAIIIIIMKYTVYMLIIFGFQ